METERRKCSDCGEEFPAPVVRLDGQTFGPSICPECSAAKEAAQQKPAAEPDDPEVLMRKAGFSDPALFGKHLGNYAVDCGAQQGALLAAAEFVRQQCSGEPEHYGLFLVGSPGRGKTHLARGCARSLAQKGVLVRYHLLLDLISDLKRMMNDATRGVPDDLVDELCRFPGLLVLDELGRSAGRAWDRDLIFRIVDRRMSRPTIYLSNYDLPHLEQHYDEAVVSRLGTCRRVLFPASIPDFRRRPAA